MQHHGNTHVRSSQRKQIVLALSLALGLSAAQAQAAADTTSPLNPIEDGPAAALMRSAAAAGIAVPRDLPYFMELAAKRRTESADPSPKATIQVTNCNNSGSGSLRAAVGFASSGDVIDLSGLNCTVTLSSSIVTTVDSLTLKGNPDNKYSISGNNTVRPLIHNGSGQLTLDGIIVRNGKVTSSSSTTTLRGGCVRSEGSVRLTNQAQVKYCEASNTATSGTPTVEGGAIFAANSATLANGARVARGMATTLRGTAQGGGISAPSVEMSGGLVEHNIARVTGNGQSASGGGIHTDGLQAKYSIVRNNSTIVAGSASTARAHGGGVDITGDEPSIIKYSTFNNNTVNADGALLGGGAAISFGATSSSPALFDMKSSTIANNSTSNSTKYGGALSLRANATIRSSTISGNTERHPDDKKYGSGITLADGVTLTMSSSIIADNNLIAQENSAGLPSDLSVDFPDSSSATVVGTQNFRRYVDESITWPSGNIDAGLNPLRLGPLQDNGGLTATMMPNADSPVIDKGGTTGLTGGVDQRGTGFPRVVGTQADIGAVEWSLVPEIFADGFESD